MKKENRHGKAHDPFNKNHSALQAIYDDELRAFTKISDIYDIKYAPPAILDHKGTISRRDLNDRWRNREIPASRHHLSKDFLYLDDVISLMEQNMGLSLSVHYWMTDTSDAHR